MTISKHFEPGYSGISVVLRLKENCKEKIRIDLFRLPEHNLIRIANINNNYPVYSY